MPKLLFSIFVVSSGKSSVCRPRVDVPSDAIETFFYLSLAAFLLPEHSGAADLQKRFCTVSAVILGGMKPAGKKKQTNTFHAVLWSIVCAHFLHIWWRKAWQKNGWNLRSLRVLRANDGSCGPNDDDVSVQPLEGSVVPSKQTVWWCNANQYSTSVICWDALWLQLQ